MSPRIDAHQHFWQVARGDYGWLSPDVPALQPLYRDFRPADLEPLRTRHGVARTVLVQAAPTVAETDYLLGLANSDASIGGVVGWVDMSDAASVSRLQSWAARPAFKGVRPMLQDLPDANWIAHAPSADVVSAMLRLGLSFDALVRSDHLPALLRFLDRWPDLPVVVDHAAKPPLQRDRLDAAWKAGIADVARDARVVCKFSGLLTELSPASGTPVEELVNALKPTWQHLLDCFGPSRLMWGSDWPVLNLAADYGTWVAVSEQLISELSTADQRRVWLDNAAAFYRLPDKAAE